jgi:hypothetical protein
MVCICWVTSGGHPRRLASHQSRRFGSPLAEELLKRAARREDALDLGSSTLYAVV